MSEITKKELIWKKLTKFKEGEALNMVSLAKEVECSLAYLSAMFRFALENEFLQFDEKGSYAIKHIPPYPEFQKAINKNYTQYRKSTKAGSSRKRKAPPKDFKFEVNEETILGVISSLIKEKKALEEKLEKVIKYTKKIKEDRDKLLKNLENISDI